MEYSFGPFRFNVREMVIAESTLNLLSKCDAQNKEIAVVCVDPTTQALLNINIPMVSICNCGESVHSFNRLIQTVWTIQIIQTCYENP